jgi:predicted nucleic-acid-binding protein
MIAIDTNVVVRFLTRDDEAQWAKAHALIRDSAVFVPATVLLETAWVLSSVRGYSHSEVCDALERFSALKNVSVETLERFSVVFAWTRQGLDFADALHLAAAADCERFVTFDRRLVKRGRSLAPPVSAL